MELTKTSTEAKPMTNETIALIPAPKSEVTLLDGDPNARLSTWVIRY